MRLALNTLLVKSSHNVFICHGVLLSKRVLCSEECHVYWCEYKFMFEIDNRISHGWVYVRMMWRRLRASTQRKCNQFLTKNEELTMWSIYILYTQWVLGYILYIIRESIRSVNRLFYDIRVVDWAWELPGVWIGSKAIRKHFGCFFLHLGSLRSYIHLLRDNGFESVLFTCCNYDQRLKKNILNVSDKWFR